MGKKRKQEQTADEIRRKIQKLQEKLNKKPRRRIIESSEDELNDNEIMAHVEVHPSPRSPSKQRASRETSARRATSRQRSPSPLPQSPEMMSPSGNVSSPSPHASLEPETSAQNVLATSSKDDTGCPDEINLDDEILQLLGEAPKEDTTFGKAIHKDIASRWQNILSKGLEKDVKDKILKEYLIPSNCDLLVAPTLNPEAKAALSEGLVKRDSWLMLKQNQIGTALAALANVTDLIISNETSKQKILKPLSDACRILCDSHYHETQTRRNFVISSTNAELKETLMDTKRDKFLFGENVSDKLKAAKTIQRSGNELKNVKNDALKSVFKKNNFAYKKNNLNAKPQHRKTDNKFASNNSRSRQQTSRAPPRSNIRKTSERSPVRRTQRRR